MPVEKLPEPRIAVVDDDESFRRAVCLTLRQNGFSSEAYDSVNAFIRASTLGRADCLVLDVFMPGIDGLSLQSCLRRTNFDTPIVFCSGTTDETIRQTALANGARVFLTKPFQPQELIGAVNAALAKSRRSSEPHATARES